MEQKKAIYTELGTKIQQRRKVLNLSQEELAGAVKLSRPSIVNIEKGAQHVTVWTLVLICAVLKCKITDLFPKIPTATFKKTVKKKTIVEYKTMAADFKF